MGSRLTVGRMIRGSADRSTTEERRRGIEKRGRRAFTWATSGSGQGYDPRQPGLASGELGRPMMMSMSVYGSFAAPPQIRAIEFAMAYAR